MKLELISKYEKGEVVYLLWGDALQEGTVTGISLKENTRDFIYNLNLKNGAVNNVAEHLLIPKSAIPSGETKVETKVVTKTETIVKTLVPKVELNAIIQQTLSLYGKWMFNNAAQKMEPADYIIQNFGDMPLFIYEEQIGEPVTTETVSNETNVVKPEVAKPKVETERIIHSDPIKKPSVPKVENVVPKEEGPIQIVDVFAMPTEEEVAPAKTKRTRTTKGTSTTKTTKAKKESVSGPIYPHQDAIERDFDSYVPNEAGYPESKSRVIFPEGEHFITINTELLRK